MNWRFKAQDFHYMSFMPAHIPFFEHVARRANELLEKAIQQEATENAQRESDAKTVGENAKGEECATK